MTDWRPIPGFPHYEASDEGEIRSCARTLMRSNGWPMRIRQRTLSFIVDADGYRRVGVNQSSQLVHRLVALAFLGEPFDGAVVDHIDQDVLNNRPSNLRWANRSVNAHNSKAIWRHNESGAKGVMMRGGRWRSYITVRNKRLYLGSYDSLDDAVTARKEAECLHL